MAELSEWLKVMLAEIQRKREEQDRAQVEHQARTAQPAAATPPAPSV